MRVKQYWQNTKHKMINTSKIYLLAYPDNPAGSVFIKTFLDANIQINGIIVENKETANNWQRLKFKIFKDGLKSSLCRIIQILKQKSIGENIIQLCKKKNIDIYYVNKFNSKECEVLLAYIPENQIAMCDYCDWYY